LLLCSSILFFETGAGSILTNGVYKKTYLTSNSSKARKGGKGKNSKRRRSNIAVIIVRVIVISSFLFYCLLLNRSFPTNPNSITNCFKLFSFCLQLHCSCVALGGHLTERNGASVYRNIYGFEISREIIDDEPGWILGKRDTQQAFYGVLDSSFLPPPRLWDKTWQFLGESPSPNVTLHHKDAVALGYDAMEEGK